MKLGEQLSPILSEIESALLDSHGIKPDFTNKGFRAATYIFISAVLDKMWELQINEEMSKESMIDMSIKCGEAVRNVVKTFTNIDTFELYK